MKRLLPLLLLTALTVPVRAGVWPPVHETRVRSGEVVLGPVSATGELRTAAELVPSQSGGVPVALEVGAQAPDNPEGYLIDVAPGGVRVVGRTPAGVLYGVETLRQLASSGHCPCLEIRDWPAMRWRAVQIDMSRGPVPHLEYLKSVVRDCAHDKLNMLGLYMEHTLQLPSQPLLAPPGGAMSAAEVRELVTYANRYNVTLLPQQQAFGHLHHMLVFERYSDVAEVPHGHVMAPSEQAYQVIDAIYRDTLPLFPGPFVHIGADETHELGMGRTRERIAREGIGKVYLDHLGRVAQILAPSHKRLMFWGDIAVKYPALLKELPHDAIAVAWNYEAHADYASLIAPFTRAGLDSFVAPGASNWNRIFPNLDVAYQNTAEFVQAGKEAHSLGAILTTWNDDNEAIFGMSWPALSYGAGCTWSERPVSVADFYREHGHGEVLEDLARCNRVLNQATGGDASDFAFWVDPFSATGRTYLARALPAARELRLAAEDALARLLSEGSPDPALVFAARRLDALGLKIQLVPEIAAVYHDAYEHQSDGTRVIEDLAKITGINGLLMDLREANADLKGQYKDLWLSENRPYYLEDVLVRYDLAIQLYQSRMQGVQAAWHQFDVSKTLPRPEEVGL